MSKHGRPPVREHPSDENAVHQTYQVFGIPFEVTILPELIRHHFEVVYHHFEAAHRKQGGVASLHFAIRQREECDSLEVVVNGAAPADLSDVFRRGSNRHRFTVVDSDGGKKILDRFLGNKWVMTILGNECLIRNSAEQAAYAESVVFHTVLSRVPSHYLLHAGVVSRNNSGIILCGNANSGKTTLTLGLVRAGFKFLSDEVAFIDDHSFDVLPFPRAVGLREQTVKMFPEMAPDAAGHPTQALSGDAKLLVDLAEVYPDCLGGPSKPEVLVFLEGFAGRTQATPITKAEAVLQCLTFAHSAEEDVFKLMMKTATLVERLNCYRVILGPVAEAVQTVSGLAKE